MSSLNLPNRITLARVAMIPLFVVLALWQFPYHDIWATLVFVVAGLTDTLDGQIARRRNLVTNLGKFLDPLADKMLVGAALVSLVALGRIPAWVVILVLCREFAVSGLRTLAADAGVVIAASGLGKLKTVTQMITIVLLLLNSLSFWPPFYHVLCTVFIWLTVIATVLSGADYLIQGRRFL